MRNKKITTTQTSNFIETIFESYKHGLRVLMKQCPMDIEIYCIGSGSNFEIHKNIDYETACNIYEQHKNELTLGTKEYSKSINGFKLECFNCMESNNGYCYTFMFQISKIIEHNPNDVIKKWEKFYEQKTTKQTKTENNK